MSKKIRKETHYNYWREVQRNQLGISANLYFIYSSTILAFEINFLIIERNQIWNCFFSFLTLSTLFLVVSLIFYALFTDNRLKDFRQTAKKFKEKKSVKIVLEETNQIGDLSWLYYSRQKQFLYLGFAFSLLGFFKYIFI